MGIFNLNRYKKDEKIEFPMSDHQIKLLVNFVNRVEEMKLIEDWSDLSQAHLIEFVRDIQSLKKKYNYNSPWILEPGMLFAPLIDVEKNNLFNTIQPVIDLAKESLKEVTDYDKLMEDIITHRRLIKSKLDMFRIGGHEFQRRDFIIDWKNKIGEQWYGIGHLVCETNYQLSNFHRD